MAYALEVEETAILSDLGNLVTSDDECYLESENTCTDNGMLGSDKALECPKCDRTYKRQGFFTRHVAVCDGKRKRQTIKSSKPIEDNKCK